MASFILFFCIIWRTVHFLSSVSAFPLFYWEPVSTRLFVSDCVDAHLFAHTPFGWSFPSLKHHLNQSTYQWVTTWPILTQLLLVKEQEARADAGHSPKPEGRMCGWGLTLTTHYQEFVTHPLRTMDVIFLKSNTHCLLDVFRICC